MVSCEHRTLPSSATEDRLSCADPQLQLPGLSDWLPPSHYCLLIGRKENSQVTANHLRPEGEQRRSERITENCPLMKTSELT